MTPTNLLSILEESFHGAKPPQLAPRVWRQIQKLEMDLSLYKPELEERFRGWPGGIAKIVYEVLHEPAPSMPRIRRRVETLIALLEQQESD